MAVSTTMHGSRAKLAINGKVVGIFNSVSYGVTYDVQPVYILGRFSAAELAYTGCAPVSVTATGWRVIDHGPHEALGGNLPRLQDLLTAGDISMEVYDRGTEQAIAKIRNVRPVSYGTTITNRALEEITVSFVGLLVDDESGVMAEPVGDGTGSTELP